MFGPTRIWILVFLIVVIIYYLLTLSHIEKNAVGIYDWSKSDQLKYQFPIHPVSGEEDLLNPKWLFDQPRYYQGKNCSVYEYHDRILKNDSPDNWIAKGYLDKISLSTICVKANIKYAQKETRNKRPRFEAIGAFVEQNINVDKCYKPESQKKLSDYLQLKNPEIYQRGHLIPCGLQPTNSSYYATFNYYNVCPVRKITNEMMSLVEDYEENILKSNLASKNSVSRKLVSIVCAQGQVHSFSKLNNNFVPLYLGDDIDKNGNYNSSHKIPVPEIIIKILIDTTTKKALMFLIPNSPTALSNIKDRAVSINFEAEKFPRMKKKLEEKIDKHEILSFCAYNIADLFPGAPYIQFVIDELEKHNIRRLEQSNLKDLTGTNTTCQRGKIEHYILSAWESTIKELSDKMDSDSIFACALLAFNSQRVDHCIFAYSLSQKFSTQLASENQTVF